MSKGCVLVVDDDARRRVQVRYVRGDTAVLETGPSQGKTIVAVGAQELFGTEVKFGK